MTIAGNSNIDDDFQYELKFAKFPYVELVKANPVYLHQLKEEFKRLAARPKVQIYIRSFIPDEEYVSVMTQRDTTDHKAPSAQDKDYVVSKSEMERRVLQLVREFHEALANNDLDPKYNGRLLNDTPIAKSLLKLAQKLNDYRHYVFDDSNMDNYQKYAVAAAKGILLTLAEIKDLFFRLTLLKKVLDISIESDIVFRIYASGISEKDQQKHRRNFNVLKTYADEVFSQAAEVIQTQIDSMAPKAPVKSEVTLADRVLRQLRIIDFIFRTQYFKYDGSSVEMQTVILGSDGRSGIDGTYIARMDILSDVKLFDIQEFKKEITERFESAQNPQLLNEQLIEIHDAAHKALSFYNSKLTKKNRIVAEFLKHHDLQIQERIDVERYDAIVVIYNHLVDYIVFGMNRHSENSAKVIRRNPEFWYFATNDTLATICRQLLDFIEKLGVIKVVDRPNDFINKHYRFFSYNLNNYKQLGDPDLTAEENVKETYKRQQLILETHFKNEFKKHDHRTLIGFLDSQLDLTPAPKTEFLDYVEKIASANLQNIFQNSSIPKSDVFHKWLKESRKSYSEEQTVVIKKATLTATEFFKEPDYTKLIDLLKESTPPMLNEIGEYIGRDRKKGGVTAWVDALEKAGKIKNLTDSQKAEALKNMFPNFTISPKALRSSSVIHRNLLSFFTARVNRI